MAMRAKWLALAIALLALHPVAAARAEDAFKIAVGQLGLWAVEGPRLGERAGIFKKHGISVEVFATAGGGDTLQAVLSGSADMTIGIGTAAVLRAFARGAPVRIIGVNFTGAGDIFWYVRADSPIHSLQDLTPAHTIAYSASGSSSHNIVLGFVHELGVKAKPTATGPMPATLTQVMSGQIDVGFSAAPLGLRELNQGKIRVIANGNDVPSLRTQSVRVDMVGADVLRTRKDAVMRFVAGYRETLDWMFTSPEAVKMYAQQINVPEELAVLTRDKFQTREAMRHDRISDINAVMADAVKLKFLDKPLTKEQLDELIQIPPLLTTPNPCSAGGGPRAPC
jgi:NitT/TauT family transport system substrate-binding protein